MKNREGVESELISVRGEKASLSQKVTELQEQMRVICGERQKGTEKESQLSTEIKTLESTLAALQAQIERNGAENGILSHDFGKTPILFFLFFVSFLWSQHQVNFIVRIDMIQRSCSTSMVRWRRISTS